MSETTSKRKPVNYDELFPGRFMKAGLILGKTPTLTISDYDAESLPQDDGKEKTRGIISFRETKLQLALNSTNGQCLKAMFGTALANWVGKRVTFCTEKDRDPSSGGQIDAIRVLGSPDIERDMAVEIKLPRRKPRTRKLQRTQPGKKQQAPNANPEPPIETTAELDRGDDPDAY